MRLFTERADDDQRAHARRVVDDKRPNRSVRDTMAAKVAPQRCCQLLALRIESSV